MAETFSGQEFNIRGLSELFRTLDDLPRKLRERLLTQAMRAGSGIVVREARRLVPKRTGALRRSIIAKRARNKFGFAERFIVGIRHGKPKAGARRQDDAYYGRFHELGTKRIEAKHFMQRALQFKAGEVIDAIAAKLRARIAELGR